MRKKYYKFVIVYGVKFFIANEGFVFDDLLQL